MNLRTWLVKLVSPVLNKSDLDQIEAASVSEGEAIAEARVRGLATGFNNVLDRFEGEFRGLVEVQAAKPARQRLASKVR